MKILSPKPLATLAMILSVSCLQIATSRAQSCPADTILGVATMSPSDSAFKYLTLSSEGAAYDLVVGRVRGRMTTVFPWVLNLLAANDEFVVTGPPSGTPLTVLLEMHGQAMVSGPASISFSASASAGNAIGRTATAGTWDEVYALPVSVVVGTPFPLRFGVRAFAGGNGVAMSAVGSVTYHFASLPAGTVIQSCQGYSEISVPTLAETWGRLKAAYR